MNHIFGNITILRTFRYKHCNNGLILTASISAKTSESNDRDAVLLKRFTIEGLAQDFYKEINFENFEKNNK